LEEVGSVPATKLAEVELSEEMDGKNSNKEDVESESAGEWQVKSKEGENNMGDKVDLPFN
jgi:hypothetical protein